MNGSRGAVRYPAQQILVATDFSDGGDAALAVAAHYARALRAQVHVLHVSGAAGTDVVRPLADVAAVVGHDVSVTFAGRSGDPAEEILLYAAAHSIDLIVVGTHGRTGVSRVLLGSVAERVIRGSRRPVLVVPMPRVPVEPTPSVVALDAEEVERPTPDRPCLICATPTRDLICEPCRGRIRGEAPEHKCHEERAGTR
jgi:nucleotide-binding universal stress UspA family protein